MKRLLFRIFLITAFLACSCQEVFSATGWLKTKPASTDNPSTLPTTVGENNAALDLMLSKFREGCRVIYLTAATLTVESGGVMVSNSDGSVRLMVANTASTSVSWSDIDTGSEAASTTYYVYAIASGTTATTFTVKISTNSSAPSGVTYYRRLGSFYNDASSNITIIYDDLFTITKYMLKTTMGEVSGGSGAWAGLTLPGGEYGFYPQFKGSGSTGALFYYPDTGVTPGGSYVTAISVYGASAALYVQQRYVTASGEDYWIFLLVDKTLDEIVSSYAAPDHPAFGNGGDFDKVPHPFNSYDGTKHEIILVEKDTVESLRDENAKIGKSILKLINDDYKPKMSKKEVYVPLHSGKYITQDNKPIKEMVTKLPDYITVRKLIKLTPEEKENKRLIHEAAIITNQKRQQEETLVQKEIKNQAIKSLEARGVVFEILKEE